MKAIKFAVLIFAFISVSMAYSQLEPENVQEISTETYLETLFNSGQTFQVITQEADAYFATKYPGISEAELCAGEHRDGSFVKYQRWKSFWKLHLNEDGTIHDISKNNNGNHPLGTKAAECTDSEILADWTNINYTSNMGYQIDQGRTSSIAFHPTDPNTFYVGAAFGGLWKTIDGGLSYEILNDNLPLAAVAAIVIHPDNPNLIAVALGDIVWYGPTTLGVYKSIDGGASFTATSLTWELTDSKRVYYMDQDPNDGNSVLIATTAGLYKTNDFFESTSSIMGTSMQSVKYSQTTADLVFAGAGNGNFYRSTDGGDSFSLITDFGSNPVRIAVPLTTSSNKVVATSGSTLHRSTDGGLTFENISLPESNMVIEFSAGSDNIIDVGNFEVYRSDDFGTSFSPVSHWLGSGGLPYIHVDQRNVFVNPLQNNFVYFCNDGGIFRYDNSADAFANLSTDLIITQYYDIAVSQTEDDVLGGGSQDNGNIYRESDGSWNRYAQTGDGMGQDIDPNNDGIRYWSYQLGGFRRWQGGSNTNISPPGEDGNGAWETPFKLDPSNSDRMLIGYNAVYESLDNGDSWSQVGDVVSPSSDLEQIAIAPSNPNKIYASRGNQIYVKQPGIDVWAQYSTPSGQGITDLEVDPIDENTVYICYSGYVDGFKVFKSIDAGVSWINITENLPNLPIMSLELYYDIPGAVFVGTYGAVYYLDDTSTEWVKYGCLPNTSVNDIEIQYHTQKVFIGTHGRGMFEAPISFNYASSSHQMMENVVSLYPNPANGYVHVKSLNNAFTVRQIIVMDALGRKMFQLDTTQFSSEITLDLSALKSGNYFVRIINQDGVEQIKKLIIN